MDFGDFSDIEVDERPSDDEEEQKQVQNKASSGKISGIQSDEANFSNDECSEDVLNPALARSQRIAKNNQS